MLTLIYFIMISVFLLILSVVLAFNGKDLNEVDILGVVISSIIWPFPTILIVVALFIMLLRKIINIWR